MAPPTTTQQRGLAIAPIPFAALSFFSSCYVIYHLLCEERHRLGRLYHRLVLAMNLALLPLSFAYAWSTFAVPAGTPNFYGASGNVNTCTAQGFISLMFQLVVPTYYGSLSLQALMGMRNNFKEDNYRWIEKYIHLIAYCFPAVVCSIALAAENFNPVAGGCYLGRYPRECEEDPDVPCQRGDDIDIIIYIITFSVVFLYFIFPPSMIIGVHCLIKRIKIKMNASIGMQRIREAARTELMRSAALQISVYLFSFWFTFIPTSVVFVYQRVTGRNIYDVLIFANCIFALQGFIMAGVYFGLQRLGKPKAVVSCSEPNPGMEVTVKAIRESAKTKAETDDCVAERKVTFIFNIFDGTPDPDSPWARFIDQEDYDSDDDADSLGE